MRTVVIRTYILLNLSIFISAIQRREKGLKREPNNYDFIVVGAGTTGCVLAARLSEKGKHTVLLLEAGSFPPSPSTLIPALSVNAVQSPNANFVKRFRSVPQLNAELANGGIVSYIVGQTIGGSSAVNGMNFNRGSQYDYDNWAKMTGDESWNYKNMLKYFRRVEDYQGDYPSDQRGSDGPITVSRSKYSPGEEIWLQAGKYLGYVTDVDPNGPQQISFTKVDHTKKHGRRVSSYTGYIEPIKLTRPNLKVLMGAKVSRVLFQGKQAIGVAYTLGTSKKLIYEYCRREIILSAGVMMTPTILMRSGIGPIEVLQKANIPPVKILPVGKNLQDHVTLGLEIIVGNRSVLFNESTDLNPDTWKIFNSIGEGPYSTVGNHAEAFIKSPNSPTSIHLSELENKKWPNLHGTLEFGSVSHLRFRPEISMAPWEGRAMLSLFVTRPRSMGSLTLNTTNIEGDPVIDFQYLAHLGDVEDMLYAIKFGLDIIEKTPSFGRVGARYPTLPLNACRHLSFRSDQYWRCYIRQIATTGLHAAGSCRMGRTKNSNAVVDTTLKVIGVKGLRVADTSIMPTVVNANTQAAAYAIGEKASSMILNEYP